MVENIPHWTPVTECSLKTFLDEAVEDESGTPLVVVEEAKSLLWDITYSNGDRVQIFSNGEKETPEPLHSYTATDPESKEVCCLSFS